ncbi:hypothetical protein [Beijerinckia indica]|uniref:Uncharacterized protein n=1 Tax=Beijerinckia indica subsp. indica (strain ATCC 9039 / DSM 1715 / NCIMB 8712) TaxID=395963 RepID=B2ILH8_BEII9|nr:hypothetical protein [Beijerinckia indica]ACB97378.1 hypothetical protein Bind_3849 [Beijerinckia indica subsp. indica ATCC 9039]
MREEKDKAGVFDIAHYPAQRMPSTIIKEDDELIRICELICEFSVHWNYTLNTDNLDTQGESETIDLLNSRLFQPLLRIIELKSSSELGVAAKEQVLAAYKKILPHNFIDTYAEHLINSINSDIRSISYK